MLDSVKVWVVYSGMIAVVSIFNVINHDCGANMDILEMNEEQVALFIV